MCATPWHASARELPQGILEPQVGREDIDGGPIVYYAISTTGMTEEQLSWFVDDTINKRLLAVPGVAQVNRSGGVNREIRVDLDPARMQSYRHHRRPRSTSSCGRSTSTPPAAARRWAAASSRSACSVARARARSSAIPA